MIKLKDFTNVQRDWFDNDFGRGKRHMNVAGFQDYYFAFSYIKKENPLGEAEVGAFTYNVSEDGNTLYGVVPKENDIGSGIIAKENEPIPVTFLNDPGTDNLRNAFGETAISINVLTKGEHIEAVVLEEGDVNINGINNILTAHKHIFEEGLRVLYPLLYEN